MVNLDRMKDLAKRQGIKQKDLFEMVGRKEWFGGDIKKGVSVPDSYVETWAAALHTTPAYLMGETDDPSPETKKEPAGIADGLSEDKRFLIECAMNMSDENARKLRAIVEQVFLERGE